jgi:hypothetical protein
MIAEYPLRMVRALRYSSRRVSNSRAGFGNYDLAQLDCKEQLPQPPAQPLHDCECHSFISAPNYTAGNVVCVLYGERCRALCVPVHDT